MSLWLVARKKVPNNCAIVSSEVKLFGRVVAIYGFKWNCVCWFVRVFVFLRVDSDKQTLKFNWPKPNSTHSQIPLYFSSANSCCFTILLAAFFYFLCVIDPLCVVFLIAKSKQSKTCASIDLLLLGDRSLNSQWMSERVNERKKERKKLANWHLIDDQIDGASPLDLFRPSLISRVFCKLCYPCRNLVGFKLNVCDWLN